MNLRRRLALRLMEHAVSVMPAARKAWADAMRAEFALLPTDREALAWAGGCLWTCYCERISPMQVFLKSLVRAAAVWLVLVAFVGVMILDRARHLHDPEIWKLVRLLSELYGGMFATLWVCEMLIAWRWKAPGKIFTKTLLRSTVLWLWPFGECVYRMSLFFTDPQEQHRIAPVFWEWLRHWLWNWVTHYPLFFVAIFVPLYISELLIARYWRMRPERAA